MRVTQAPKLWSLALALVLSQGCTDDGANDSQGSESASADSQADNGASAGTNTNGNVSESGSKEAESSSGEAGSSTTGDRDSDTQGGSTTGETGASEDATAEGANTEAEAESSSSDSGGVCGAECNLFDQDCGSEDLRCTSVACAPENQPSNIWDTAACMSQGFKRVGETCKAAHEGTPQDHCERGAMCFNGLCVPLCTGSAENPGCESTDYTCLVYETIMATCLKKCDPFAVDCPNGDRDMCMAWGLDFVCTPRPEDESIIVGPREPCACSNCCPNGFHCTDASLVESDDCAGEDWCCAQLCNLEDGASCDGETEVCEDLNEEPLPEWDHVGVCVVPVAAQNATKTDKTFATPSKVR